MSSFLHKLHLAHQCIDPRQRRMQNPMILWEKCDISFKYISTEQLFLNLHEAGRQTTDFTTRDFLERTVDIFLMIQSLADPDIFSGGILPLASPRLRGRHSRRTRCQKTDFLPPISLRSLCFVMVLMRCPPQSLRHLKTWSPIGGCLGRVRRYELAEQGVSLG